MGEKCRMMKFVCFLICVLFISAAKKGGGERKNHQIGCGNCQLEEESTV